MYICSVKIAIKKSTKGFILFANLSRFNLFFLNVFRLDLLAF